MLPRFLVIGAMKAGTTTMYEDLRAHPWIFLPEKELGSLNSRDINSAGGRARYSGLFSHATPGQVCGEVSATYAKLPESSGVVDRAATLLGNDCRILYLVRDPVDRIVSHHHHELSHGATHEASINVAVRSIPRLIDYTRYGTQIQPWVNLVGADHVRIIQFEHYMNDRAGTLDSILDFLKVPLGTTTADLSSAHNVSAGLRIATRRAGHITRSAGYRRLVRPWLPNSARRLGRRLLLPTAPPRPSPPSPQTVDFITGQIEPELRILAHLGLSLPPLWDAESTKRRYWELHRQAALEH